jgi:hypothetical protein
MSTFQIVGAVIGSLIIAVTLWKILRHGVTKSNGKIPESNTSWGSSGLP